VGDGRLGKLGGAGEEMKQRATKRNGTERNERELASGSRYYTPSNAPLPPSPLYPAIALEMIMRML
jgi:hypothetical protein